MVVGERIEHLIDLLKTSENAFAKKMGKHNMAIRHITKGRKRNGEIIKDVPGAEILSLICATYNVDANWLLLGIGEPFRKEQEQEQQPPTGTAQDVKSAEIIAAQDRRIAKLNELVTDQQLRIYEYEKKEKGLV